MSGYWRTVGGAAWRDMGLWRWAGLVLILISLALTPIAGPSFTRWQAVPAVTQGAGTATLESHALLHQSTLRARMSFDSTGWVYRIGDGNWRRVEDELVEVELERSVSATAAIEACVSTNETDCWRWLLGTSTDTAKN